jgi:serine/threonine protein kinase
LAAADPLHQQPSNVIGKFRLIAELGRGGMSEVYLAIVAGPAGFNKLVVIKLIKAELAEDPDFISMFLEEARLSARLSHPNVVQTNEVGEVGGRYYIAMEYLEGQPYSRILHRLGRDRGLPLGMSLRILSDVLAGLQYAHELADFDGSPLGVVHRDVTPHNVFVTYDGQVKVVDFGIAKAMNSSHETRTGMLKGKVGYMAPEQAKGERVDRRADLFSVGVMLWEAAVGRRLWKGLNEVQILHQLLSGEIPSPRSMRPDISVPLEQLIMKSLDPDREKRHASAVELQTALDELMDAGSERSTLRETGRLLSSTFEEERRKLKAIVEQQVARSANLATGMYQQMAIPNVAQAQAYTGELPRASQNPHFTGSHLTGPHLTGSHAAGFQQGGFQQGGFPHGGAQHGGAQHGGNQGQLSGPQSGALPQFGHGSGPSYLPGSGAQPAPGSNPGQAYSGSHSSYPHGSHPGASYNAGQPMQGQAMSGHGSHPGASYSQSNLSYTGQSHAAYPAGPTSTGSIPRLAPHLGGNDGSQPSVSSSLAHLSVSRSPHSHAAGRPSDGGSKKVTMAALGIAGAAGGLAALLYVGFGRSQPAPASDPSSTPTMTAAATSTSTTVTATATAEASSEPTSVASGAAVAEVKLDIKVTPDDADIFLDGKKLGTGSVLTSVPRDGKEHELKVDAAGYSAKTRKIKAEETTVSWEPELTADRRHGGPVPKTTATATSDSPTGPKRDKNGKIVRDIDKEYPGGN